MLRGHLWEYLSLQGNNKMKQTLQSNQKRSRAMKGHIFSEEHNKKISEARKKMFREGKVSFLGKNNPFYGKHHTKDFKRLHGKKIKEWFANPENKLKHSKLTSLAMDKPEIKKILKRKKSKETREKIRIARSKQDFSHQISKDEIKVKNFLDQLNIKYIQQYLIEDIKHPFKCDFYISEKNLVLEIDGYWHLQDYRRKLDSIRNVELGEKGYNLIRLIDYDIKDLNIDKLQEKLGAIQ